MFNLGREPTKGLRLIDGHKLNQDTREVLSTLDVDLNPQIRVSSLGIGKQQLVEIAKALSKKSQVLILDEPTSPKVFRCSNKCIIENKFYKITFDALKDGGIISFYDKKMHQEVIKKNRVANDLVIYEEYK